MVERLLSSLKTFFESQESQMFIVINERHWHFNPFNCQPVDEKARCPVPVSSVLSYEDEFQRHVGEQEAEEKDH